MKKTQYIVGVDQSTQGTKALLFDRQGRLLMRKDKPHRQIISREGWISHDPQELYQNTLQTLRELIRESGIDADEIQGIGISNQRETSIAWERESGRPLADAVVWQCSRAQRICEERRNQEDMVKELTGIPLSPYFPAAKYAWLLQNCPEAQTLSQKGQLCLGTVDSYLVFRLTKGSVYKTDYSNASRTQLFNLKAGCYDQRLCDLFGISMDCLPQIEASDGDYGQTDLEGFLARPVPIHAAMGDSHGALFGQGCFQPGMTKATYGTGSSIMMNVGDKPVFSTHGIVSSVGFKTEGRLHYVLEGNLNYTGAVISWLKDDMQLIRDAGETEELARLANPMDRTCIVPAFSGLGAPYWDSSARAAVIGMSRTTGRAEFVKAALSCIAHQITDVVEAMEKDCGIPVHTLRTDGGPTRNRFLMELQSGLCGSLVQVSETEELSGMGAAYAAGIAMGFFDHHVFDRMNWTVYHPLLSGQERLALRMDWKQAVERILRV